MTDPDQELYGAPPAEPADPEAAAAMEFGVAAAHNRRATYLLDRRDQIVGAWKAETERLADALALALEPLDREVLWRLGAVEAFHRRNVAALGKTVQFPSGPPSKLTLGQPELVVADEDAFRAWAAEQGLEALVWPVKPAPEPVLSRTAAKKVAPAAIDKKQRPEAGSIVAAVTADGEPIPGVHYLAPGDTWGPTMEKRI